MSGTLRPIYSYQVDARDIMTSVNAEWLAFAAENNARELQESAVLGRSLWDFVAGGETIRLYQTLLARIRMTQHAVVLPFRCDSPTLQRHMRMTITPEDSEEIRFECVIDKVRPTAHLAVLDPAQARSRDHLDMCSCCKRIDIEPLGWLEVSEVVGRLNLFEAVQVPTMRQTVCRECQQQAKTS